MLKTSITSSTSSGKRCLLIVKVEKCAHCDIRDLQQFVNHWPLFLVLWLWWCMSENVLYRFSFSKYFLTPLNGLASISKFFFDFFKFIMWEVIFPVLVLICFWLLFISSNSHCSFFLFYVFTLFNFVLFKKVYIIKFILCLFFCKSVGSYRIKVKKSEN